MAGSATAARTVGLGELGAELTAALGAAPDLAALIAEPPLEYAQAWSGLAANPTRGQEVTETAAESAQPVETEEAA